MKYKGIIFDFNGVLLWDTAWQREAWDKYALIARGIPFTDHEFLEQVGRTNKSNLEFLYGKDLIKKEVDELTQKKEAVYRKICLKKGRQFKLSPGAKDLLNFLTARDIPHTIATSSEIINVRFFFKYLQLGKWFDFKRVVFDDGKLRGKPAPDIYQKAAGKLRLSPKDCLVVEDAKSGLLAAHKAKIGKIIFFVHQRKFDKKKIPPFVKQTITSLDQIRKEDFCPRG